jgi:hypothetical protein
LREKERIRRKKCASVFTLKWNIAHQAAVFSLHILQHLSKKNVATSIENLISNNKGEIKKTSEWRKFSLRQMVLFDFFFLIHWSSEQLFEILL